MRTTTAFFMILLLGNIQLPLNAETFIGPVTGKEIYFRIILPENYNSSTERYPVIYHLHGLNNNADGDYGRMKPRVDSAIMEGVIRPVIMVFPSGYRDSFWGDSYRGDKPAETNLICELIPYIDSHYRTRPTRDFRVIQGWSMGGAGAMMYLAKFCNMFGIGISYDGALHSYDTLLESNSNLSEILRNILKNNFNMDREYFNRFCPWENLRKNADKMKELGVYIKIVTRINNEKTKRYRDLLLELGFKPEYSEVQCEHVAACVYGYEAKKGFRFIEERLGK
jgi:hypothetical protein